MEDYASKQAALCAALVKVVSETKDVVADSTNPFHKNKYASLSAHLSSLKPVFAKHDLAVIQAPIGDANGVGVKTIIIHKDGGSLETDCLIPCAQGMDGQKAGALISYIRRYAMASIAGVATEDDDANSTMSAPASAPRATYTPKPKQDNIVSPSEIDPAMPVPFGKMKGTPVGELPIDDLKYWATVWEPKPWEKTGKVGPKDLKLKATAVALYFNKNDNGSDEEDGLDVPF
jgi:hypothetical protein